MLKFCNSHPARIWTAISFYSPENCSGEGGEWQNIGWYPVEPGSCAVVYQNDLADVNQFWYYFAEAEDGHEWSGDFPTYVTNPEAFNICSAPGSSAYDSLGFRELDIGEADNYTLTFTT